MAGSNQDAIWEHFQNEGADSFAGARERLRFLARQLRPGSRVLNIGVGGGTLEAEAQRLGMTISSLDPSERAIAAIRQRLQMADRAQVGYADAIPFADGSFDAVVASEVFEHLTPDVLHRALREIHRVLAPGGMLLGTVPAREPLAEQLVVCPGCALRFHRWGHQQAFTCASLRALLAEHWQVEALYEKYFVPSGILNWKGQILCRAKALLCMLGIHGRDENIVFRASKAAR